LSSCLIMTEKGGGDGPSDEAQYIEAVRAMESGDEKAKTKVAFYMLSGRGGAEIDPDTAVALLEERVKDGDIDAKWMLGLCCEYGMGIKQDITRALELYRQCDADENEIGRFFTMNYEGGRGTGNMIVQCLSSGWC